MDRHLGKMVVIGSQAINKWLPGFRPNPKDLDLVMTFDTFLLEQERLLKGAVKHGPLSDSKYVIHKPDEIIEIEFAWPGTSSEQILDFSHCYFGGPFAMPPLEVLYAIKDSHKYKKDCPHFAKTRRDIEVMHRMSPNKCSGVVGFYQQFRTQRELEFDPSKRPRLKDVKKSEFFSGDGVEYVYDHDSIHEAVAVGKHPAYTYYLKPGSEVECSKELFFSVDPHIRLHGVLEESYVLALERSQIPNRANENRPSPLWSFTTALQKVCTSITGGWFREFAWENYYVVQRLYDPKYTEKFWALVDAGEVKPYKEPNE